MQTPFHVSLAFGMSRQNEPFEFCNSCILFTDVCIYYNYHNFITSIRNLGFATLSFTCKKFESLQSVLTRKNAKQTKKSTTLFTCIGKGQTRGKPLPLKLERKQGVTVYLEQTLTRKPKTLWTKSAGVGKLEL